MLSSFAVLAPAHCTYGIEHQHGINHSRMVVITRAFDLVLLFKGRVIYALYIMSDCYLGMDQQYSVCLDVEAADISAQFNTEVTVEDGELDQLVEHYTE